jgi:hypothetical protein
MVPRISQAPSHWKFGCVHETPKPVTVVPRRARFEVAGRRSEARTARGSLIAPPTPTARCAGIVLIAYTFVSRREYADRTHSQRQRAQSRTAIVLIHLLRQVRVAATHCATVAGAWTAMSGALSTVGGDKENTASGAWSFAAGHRPRTRTHRTPLRGRSPDGTYGLGRTGARDYRRGHCARRRVQANCCLRVSAPLCRSWCAERYRVARPSCQRPGIRQQIDVAVAL